jgi:hypothetical protein
MDKLVNTQFLPSYSRIKKFLSMTIKKYIMQNQQIETLETIEHTYPNQWVLVKETEWDKRGNPIKGMVIAHDTEREALVQPCIQLHDQEAKVKTYAFYTGEIVPEGMEVIL